MKIISVSRSSIVFRHGIVAKLTSVVEFSGCKILCSRRILQYDEGQIKHSESRL